MVGGRFEPRITPAAIAALGQQNPLAVFGQIDEDFVIFGVDDLRANGDFQGDVVGCRTVAVATHAVPAGLGFEMLFKAVVDQRVQIAGRLDPYVTAAPAVAAIRPAVADIFLASEGHAACAARAGGDEDFRLIKEFHVASLGASAAFGQLRKSQR